MIALLGQLYINTPVLGLVEITMLIYRQCTINGHLAREVYFVTSWCCRLYVVGTMRGLGGSPP